MDVHLDQTLAIVDLAQCHGMSIGHFSCRLEVAQTMNPAAHVTTKDTLAFAHLPFKTVEFEVGKVRSHFEGTHLCALVLRPGGCCFSQGLIDTFSGRSSHALDENHHW